jgi:hypothetical protein
VSLIGSEVERRPPELEHADLERHSCSRRRLLEDHPERSPLEVAVVDPLALARLEAVAELEDDEQLLGGPVVDTEEIPPLEGRRDHAGILASRDLDNR